jgi:hypothetical protein
MANFFVLNLPAASAIHFADENSGETEMKNKYTILGEEKLPNLGAIRFHFSFSELVSDDEFGLNLKMQSMMSIQGKWNPN